MTKLLDTSIATIGFAACAVLAFFLAVLPASLVALPVVLVAGQSAYLAASYVIAAVAALYVARSIVLRGEL